MDITIYPKKLSGTVNAIPSKSQAHRLLICSAFAQSETKLYSTSTNQDIEATADCLRSLGAKIVYADGIYTVIPITELPKSAMLNCRESGSTLRFLLPIVGALGVDTTFIMEGRLPQRPLSPLWEEMQRHGCQLSRPTENTIRCTGRLSAGMFEISGNISSQFITGLLFAMALIEGNSTLHVIGKLESEPYVQMTCDALAAFGISTKNFSLNASNGFQSPGKMQVEGDWSNAAFFLAAKCLGSELSINGLDPNSSQGDRAVSKIIETLSVQNATIDAADIPDIVPILAVVAGAKHGATFLNIERLRLKESDRVASVASMLDSFGIQTKVTENAIHVFPGAYHGATIDSVADHRIAMSAAIAATVSDGAVTILNAQCVAKSYPTFWDEYRRLGGSYEQYIR